MVAACVFLLVALASAARVDDTHLQADIALSAVEISTESSQGPPPGWGALTCAAGMKVCGTKCVPEAVECCVGYGACTNVCPMWTCGKCPSTDDIRDKGLGSKCFGKDNTAECCGVETIALGNPITITSWKEFDLQKPVFGRKVTGETPEIYRIVEKPRFGKLPDYEVYYQGKAGALLERPALFYKHDNKILPMDANINDGATKKRVLEWRGYRWMSLKAQAKAFITSANLGTGKAGNQTYFTMTKLTPWGKANKGVPNHHLNNDPSHGYPVSWTFTLDSGRCPKNKRSACGKRLINAQEANGQSVWFYADGSTVPVADLVKTKRSLKLFGFGDEYSLRVQPGQDPLLLANFALFIDAAQNREWAGELPWMPPAGVAGVVSAR